MSAHTCRSALVAPLPARGRPKGPGGVAPRAPNAASGTATGAATTCAASSPAPAPTADNGSAPLKLDERDRDRAASSPAAPDGGGVRSPPSTTAATAADAAAAAAPAAAAALASASDGGCCSVAPPCAVPMRSRCSCSSTRRFSRRSAASFSERRWIVSTCARRSYTSSSRSRPTSASRAAAVRRSDVSAASLPSSRRSNSLTTRESSPSCAFERRYASHVHHDAPSAAHARPGDGTLSSSRAMLRSRRRTVSHWLAPTPPAGECRDITVLIDESRFATTRPSTVLSRRSLGTDAGITRTTGTSRNSDSERKWKSESGVAPVPLLHTWRAPPTRERRQPRQFPPPPQLHTRGSHAAPEDAGRAAAASRVQPAGPDGRGAHGHVPGRVFHVQRPRRCALLACAAAYRGRERRPEVLDEARDAVLPGACDVPVAGGGGVRVLLWHACATAMVCDSGACVSHTGRGRADRGHVRDTRNGKGEGGPEPGHNVGGHDGVLFLQDGVAGMACSAGHVCVLPHTL